MLKRLSMGGNMGDSILGSLELVDLGDRESSESTLAIDQPMGYQKWTRDSCWELRNMLI